MIDKIFDSMVRYGDAVQHKKFPVTEFTKLLRKFIGTDNIKVKTRRAIEVDYNMVIVGGIYDPWLDESNLPGITLYISYHPEQTHIQISDIEWSQLCVDLIECAGHEIVHQEQYRARNFDIGPHIFVSGSDDEQKRDEQNYLGDPDEVEAYGFSIAAEVFLKSRPTRISSKHVAQTAMFKAYKKAFGVRHPIVCTLLEQTIKYYCKLNTEIYNVKRSK